MYRQQISTCVILSSECLHRKSNCSLKNEMNEQIQMKISPDLAQKFDPKAWSF